MTNKAIVLATALTAGVASNADANILKDSWKTASSAVSSAASHTWDAVKSAGNYTGEIFWGKDGKFYANLRNDTDFQAISEKSTYMGGDDGTTVCTDKNKGSSLTTKTEAEIGIKKIKNYLDAFFRVDDCRVFPNVSGITGSLDQTILSLGLGFNIGENRYWAAVPALAQDNSNITVDYAGLKVKTKLTGNGLLIGYDGPKGFQVIGQILNFDGNSTTVPSDSPEMVSDYAKKIIGGEVRHPIVKLPYGRITGREYARMITENGNGQTLDTMVLGGSVDWESPRWNGKKGSLYGGAGIGVEASQASCAGLGANTRDYAVGARVMVKYDFPQIK